MDSNSIIELNQEEITTISGGDVRPPFFDPDYDSCKITSRSLPPTITGLDIMYIHASLVMAVMRAIKEYSEKKLFLLIDDLIRRRPVPPLPINTAIVLPANTTTA